MNKAAKTRRLRQTLKLKKEIETLKALNKELRKHIEETSKADYISLARMLDMRSRAILDGKEPIAFVVSLSTHTALRQIPQYLEVAEYGASDMTPLTVFGCRVVVDPSITGWYLQNRK